MSNCLKIIDLKNLRYNLKRIRSILNKDTKLCAVVKDNAYGHGIENVVPTMNKYVNYYAIANLDEGKELRKLSELPILCLGEFFIEDINKALENDIEVTISNLETLIKLKKIELKKPIKVHLAVNTGMHRLGFSNKTEFKKALQIIQFSPYIQLKGIYSHVGDYTNAERTKMQNDRFLKWYALLPKNLKAIAHISNSGAMHLFNNMHYDMVRTGIGLYGYEVEGLKPVMSVLARIVNVIKLKHDDYVGYGSQNKLSKGAKLAVINIGYGQGYLRSNAKYGFVIINGKLCKIVANVCMDMIIVDATSTNCKIGEYATIMGKNGVHSISAEQIAVLTNTITYEVLTNFDKIKSSVILK